MNRLAFAAIAIPFMLHVGSARAIDLVVEVKSSSNPPLAVVAQEIGGAAVVLAAIQGKSGFRQTLAPQAAASWVNRYILVARWDAARQQICLRVTEAIRAPISIRIFHLAPVADAGTLDRIENLGADLDALLEKYFVARDVHRSIGNPVHEVAIRAFKDWFDAHFELARQYPFIDRDDEVIAVGTELYERAKTDKRVRVLLEKFLKPGYFDGMKAQLDVLEWRDVKLVRDLQRAQNLEQAAKVNDHFIGKFSDLSATQRRAVADFQGVNEALLTRNAAFLKTLNGM